MNEIKFACPSCGQHLQVEADCVGARIQCPACQNDIVIPGPADQAVLQTIEDPANAGPAGPAPGNNRRVGALVGVAVAILLLAGGAVWALFLREPGAAVPPPSVAQPGSPMVASEGAGENTADVAEPPSVTGPELPYVSPEAEFLVIIRLADLWAAPLFQSLLANMDAPPDMEQIRQQFGLTPSEIERVVIASPRLEDLMSQGAALAQNFNPLGGRVSG
jgi:hypothetical protein